MAISKWWVTRDVDRGNSYREGEVTVAVKDLYDIEGEVTCAGSRVVQSRGLRATKDSTVVSNLRRSEAVIVGRSITTELAFAAQGVNPFFGTPTNPRFQDMIPGGSSSGSAAAVACGDVVIGLGSDTGGSIRIPATCCGIYGLKTTLGRVDMEGVWPLAGSLDTLGPLARSVSDLHKGLSLMEGVAASSLEGVSPFSKILKVSTSSSKRIEGVVDKTLESQRFAVCESYSFVHHTILNEFGAVLMGYEAYQNNRAVLDEAHRMDPWVRKRLESQASISRRQYEEALEVRRELQELYSSLLERLDAVMVLATIPVSIPRRKEAYSAALNTNTLPFNVLGLPVLSIPVPLEFATELTGPYSNFLKSGDKGQGCSELTGEIPVSFQIVGPRNSEERLLATAMMFEELFATKAM